MDEFNFNDILTDDEIDALFVKDDDLQEPPPDKKGDDENNDTTEVDVDDIFPDASPESVSSEENKQELEDTSSKKKGTSPNNFYSSIAKALNEDSVLLNSNEVNLDDINSAEEFSALIEAEIQSRLDEKQKRIDDALNNGVEPTAVQQFEKTLSYLDSLTDDAISDESEQGENLRKNLIYQDFINRGYSKERALREVTKSFNAGSDLDDAKEALQSNKDFYKESYDKIIKEAKEAELNRKKEIQKEANTLKKSILEDDKVFGELVIDSNQRKKIYDNISKPVYKDEDTGEMLTAIQKYEKENHTDFMKYVGLVFTLTDGFKNLDGLIKGKVNKELKKGLKNLETALNNSTRNSDGSLNFVTSRRSNDDDSYIGLGWVPDI